MRDYTKLMIETASDEEAAKRGMYFSVKHAAWSIWWIERHCRLYESEWAGRPFILRNHQDEELDKNGFLKICPIPFHFPKKFSGSDFEKMFCNRLDEYIRMRDAGEHLAWQFHMHAKAYGWQKHSPHWERISGRKSVRRFQRVNCFVPKKSGKSPTMAANIVYLTAGDGETAGKTYVLSKEGSQVKDNIGAACDKMIQQSPELKSQFRFTKADFKYTHLPSGSMFKPQSALNIRNLESKEGPSANFMLDETHVLTRGIYEIVKYAGIARPQPLHWTCSTAGKDYDSLGKDLFDEALDILNDEVVDVGTLACVYSADQNLTDSQLTQDIDNQIKKANPMLGITIGWDEIRSEYDKVKSDPHQLSVYKRYRLNIFSQTETPAFNVDRWNESEEEISLEDFYGRECWWAFDRALTSDLTSLCMLFEHGNDFAVFFKHWLPQETALAYERNNDIEYDNWEKKGFIDLVPGEVVTDGVLKKELLKLHGLFDVQHCQFDPSRCSDLMKQLSAQGLVIEVCHQNRRDFHEYIDTVDSLIKLRKIKHRANDLVEWQIGNCNYDENNYGHRLLKKPKSRWRKIDAAVSLTMAVRAHKLDVEDNRCHAIADPDAWNEATELF